jgi:SAM-dependent methyltransferase
VTSNESHRNSTNETPYLQYETWKGWDSLFQVDDDSADYFQRECAGLDIADANVLEIGFGSGSFVAWAVARGARVCGVERIPALVEAARRFGIEVFEPEIDRIAETHRHRFDSIFAFDVFEHLTLDEIRTELDALGTMLKPGGHLLLRFPNAQSPFGLAPQYGDPTHKTGLSRGVFEQMTQGSGWKVVRYQGAARAPGRTLSKRAVRWVRYAIQDLIGSVLNAVYAQKIPWDAVVVLVLRRDPAAGR